MSLTLSLKETYFACLDLLFIHKPLQRGQNIEKNNNK